MDTDRPSQEGREDVPSELSFSVSAPQADPTPVVTRPSEGTRPGQTSAMVTRSRAREGRGLSVAPEAQIAPEIETRPEREIATCEESLGAARPFSTDAGSLFTFADKPEIATVHTSQEVTETSFYSSATSQASLPHISTTYNEKYIRVFTRRQTTWVIITLTDDDVENILNH